MIVEEEDPLEQVECFHFYLIQRCFNGERSPIAKVIIPVHKP